MGYVWIPGGMMLPPRSSVFFRLRGRLTPPRLIFDRVPQSSVGQSSAVRAARTRRARAHTVATRRIDSGPLQLSSRQIGIHDEELNGVEPDFERQRRIGHRRGGA